MSQGRKKLVCKVNPQTLWNLYKLAMLLNCGDNLGRVIDKLVREKMLSLRVENSSSLKSCDATLERMVKG